MASYPAFDPTALIAGDFPVRSRGITVASGSNAGGATLKRGTLVGRVTATGKYIPSVATASDGSQLGGNLRILAEEIDTSAADVSTPGYASGEFAFEAMIVDPSWTLATLRAAIDTANIGTIFIRSVGAAA